MSLHSYTPPPLDMGHRVLGGVGRVPEGGSVTSGGKGRKYSTVQEFVSEETTRCKRPFPEDLSWCINKKGAQLIEKDLEKGYHSVGEEWEGPE